MVSKELTCTFCKKGQYYAAGGFLHDEHMSILCQHCKSPMFSAEAISEKKIKDAMPVPVTTSYQYYPYGKKEAVPIKLSNLVSQSEEVAEPVAVAEEPKQSELSTNDEEMQLFI